MRKGIWLADGNDLQDGQVTIPAQFTDALVILAWLVLFVVALGLAEIAVSIVAAIVVKIKRIVK